MSKIEVNQISSQCGSTLTIGQSGDTIQLACGATQTGFGRTGTVDWDTTAKTASFTAVSGNGYFVNTTSAAITLTLPASPSAGDIVAFKDYAYTFATNNLTVDGNGSPIGGVDGTVNPTYSTNGTSKTFIYVDGTKGWLVTNESTDTSQEANPLYVTATGGTVTCCGDYKIHTFTGPGTFCVSCAGNSCGSNELEYVVVAGGGGGGSDRGGGAGAGGFRFASPSIAPLTYPGKPLAGSTLTAAAQPYPITVGAGGTGSTSVPGNTGCAGSNSVFSTITSAGGGFGGAGPGGGGNGGSGGGGGCGGPRAGGSGNTPPVNPAQGTDGGTSLGGEVTASSGGGAIGAGEVGGPSNRADGGTGAGLPTAFGSNGEPSGGFQYYAGGGGGGGGDNLIPFSPNRAAGGLGGGGQGGTSNNSTNLPGEAGTTNTGGGAGGGGNNNGSANGGSGIVIIRYKYQ